MGSATTQSPIQEITQAEAEAKRRIEEANAAAQKEIAAFQAEELERLEKRKAELKEESQKELKTEENACKKRVEEGTKSIEKEKETLQGGWQQKKPGIVAELIEKFLSLAH